MDYLTATTAFQTSGLLVSTFLAAVINALPLESASCVSLVRADGGAVSVISVATCSEIRTEARFGVLLDTDRCFMQVQAIRQMVR